MRVSAPTKKQQQQKKLCCGSPSIGCEPELGDSGDAEQLGDQLLLTCQVSHPQGVEPAVMRLLDGRMCTTAGHKTSSDCQLVIRRTTGKAAEPLD